jgi:hypothetical protein
MNGPNLGSARIATMATEQDDYTSCPDDDAPVALGHVDRIVHDAWAHG